MKKIILSILTVLTIFTLSAQDFKQFFITTGGAFGTHQNQTFSQSALSGGGIGFAIGGEKQAKNLFRWQLDIPVQFYTINELDPTQSTIVDPSLSFTWMKGIKKMGQIACTLEEKLKGQFFTEIAPIWEIMEILFYTIILCQPLLEWKGH